MQRSCFLLCVMAFVSDGPISFNSERNGGKNASKNYVFAFPQRATAFTEFDSAYLAFAGHGCHRAKY